MISSIFKNKLLNIWTTAYEFFVTVRLFVRSKAAGYAHVIWFWHKRSDRKNIPIGSDVLRVELLQLQPPPISKVMVKNMGSCESSKEKSMPLTYPILVPKSKVL